MLHEILGGWWSTGILSLAVSSSVVATRSWCLRICVCTDYMPSPLDV